jgi:thymidylate synthase (FAD)
MDPAQQFHLIDNPNLKEPIMNNELRWTKYFPLSDKNAFICLVDHMGEDSSIVQAARVSYGKDEQEIHHDHIPDSTIKEYVDKLKKDRQLIRYLMNHSHTTPFEMVEIKFMIQVPMDCWRQWIRHRTASVNEYSTRYTEALDMQQTTLPGEWRLQATDNKQGSSGFLDEQVGNLITVEEAEDLIQFMPKMEYRSTTKGGNILSQEESLFHVAARKLYELRLKFGIAKEQARKDLPLSTYTRAYWKCDLHNIFNFLRLRMDSHAQLEIRQFANCMFEIVKQICPVACEAFEDYVLNAKKFSRMEMEFLTSLTAGTSVPMHHWMKPESMTDREWKEFLKKLS